MTPLRTITVCVDYADLLEITLPYNLKHFQEVMVVTSPDDERTIKFCNDRAIPHFCTDAFYRNGAKFNKWLALEEGLDHFGRHGWICLLDADVLWPQDAWRHLTNLRQGFLYTPRRRMYPTLPRDEGGIPPESDWRKYPLHNNEAEFAGYSQIFHAEDSVLGPAPWHETNWTHCGGADSFLQMKWPTHLKIRPAFEVLHLGECGVNWMGRATAYTDGSKPKDGGKLRMELYKMLVARRGKSGARRFDSEKI